MARWLEGQSALVTGASSGIGAAIAIELARHGANVTLNYFSSKSEAEKIADRIHKSGGNAITVKADVSKPDDVDHLFNEALEAFGSLDIMVANAGIQKDSPFREMSYKDWQRVLDVNLTGQFLCAQRATQIFCQQGIRPEISKSAGKIVCVGSVHQIIPWAGHVNYAAAKAGVEMMMESAAQELAHEKIRINAVAPGAIRTPINQDVWSDDEKLRELLTLVPYGRIGEPDDVGRTVAWLVSDEADYVVGTTLYVDGGMALYPGFVGNG